MRGSVSAPGDVTHGAKLQKEWTRPPGRRTVGTMRAAAAVLIVVVLTSCTVRGAKIAAAGMGVATAGAVTLTAAQIGGGSGPASDVVATVGVLTWATGGLLLFWGVGVGF